MGIEGGERVKEERMIARAVLHMMAVKLYALQ